MITLTRIRRVLVLAASVVLVGTQALFLSGGQPHVASARGPVGQIAFRSERDGGSDIYLINSDGSNLTRLTQNGKRNGVPTWSPDGARLAYVSDGDICIIAIEAPQKERCLTAANQRVMNVGGTPYPVWSPDGRFIVYSANFPDGQLLLLDVTTGSTRELTRSHIMWPLSWSPDGKRLAAPAFIGDSAIIIVNIETGAEERFEIQSPPNISYGIMLQWSPDGSQFAFLSFVSEFSASEGWKPYGALSLVNTQGKDFRILARSIKESFGRLAWSPDGTRIAFNGDLTAPLETNLYVINADGSNLIQLTQDLHNIGDMAWSPDGQQIVLVADANVRHLYLINADGSGLHRLTDGFYSSSFPVWRPLPKTAK